MAQRLPLFEEHDVALMSTRPASPPPIARWPFYAGVILLIAVAFFLLITGGRPPAALPLVASMVCLGGSIVLCVIPEALANERRLRLAEAAVRDGAEAQLRRLAQTADQLTHVVSRGQSTEEQAGRALATLEEVAERMVAQAEELASALARSGEREEASRAEEMQRLTEERDEKLTALEIRLNATSVALSETQSAIKKASASSSRSIESLAVRLEEIADELRAALAARPTAPVHEPAPAPAAPATSRHETPDTPTPVGREIDTVPAAETFSAPVAVPPAAAPAADETIAEASEGSAPVEPARTDTVVAASEAPPTSDEAAPHPRPRKPRAPRPIEKPADDAPAADMIAPPEEAPPAKPTAPLELALEGMPEPRPVMRLNRREPPGSTSLVATAYIGIGNKLFIRGDGPGLSWEQGVPMQFLAIGKWGWTTTDAAVPVTCRVYRNDDTPMLEENIVIDPGTKAEITPKF